jgi:uncharacterized protein YfdQ (DUF2303 family)
MELNLTTQPAADGITKIQTLTAADTTQPKRSRKLQDLASVVAYLRKWGDASKGTIYWTDKQVVVLLDETDLTTGRGQQDKLVYGFERPVVAEKWLQAVGKEYTHKDFQRFLELRWNEIIGGADFFAKISTLSLSKSITYDAKLSDDHTYSVSFKSDAGPDVAKLPKVIEVDIPLLKGSAKTYRLQLRLTFDVPTDDKESPTFSLAWDDREALIEKAASDAVAELATELDGWLIVNGSVS